MKLLDEMSPLVSCPLPARQLLLTLLARKHSRAWAVCTSLLSCLSVAGLSSCWSPSCCRVSVPIPWMEEPGVAKSRTRLSEFTHSWESVGRCQGLLMWCTRWGGGSEMGARRGAILVSSEVATETETYRGFFPTQQLGKTSLNCKADRVTIASPFMVPMISLSEFHNALLGGFWQILQPHLSQPSTLQPHRSSHSYPFIGSCSTLGFLTYGSFLST